MDRVFKHVILPALPALAVVGLYFTPVSLFGCATRGLIALAVAGAALLCALVTVGIGLVKRIKADKASEWWILSTVILIVPALLLLGPLG